MKVPGICSAILCLVLSCPLLLSGQAFPNTPTPAAAQDLYPDQGYLSATRYVNRYFGFAFDLPSDAQVQPVPQPVARDGRIQILQLAGPPPAYAVVSIFALPLRAKTTADAKVVLRKGLDQELLYGVEEVHGLSKITLAGHLFYFYETRRGADQHMALATNLAGYAVLAVLAANNEKTVKELEASFQNVTFLTPAEVRVYAGADALEYEGPAISSHRLAQLQADPPANHIDAGKVLGNVYENQALGFRYQIQPGWTLFSAWAKRPGADGQLSYDDFGEVTASAASTACFPGMRFPASATDRRAVEEFLLQFGLTHPVLRDMRDAKAFTAGDSVVVYLHGTVAFQIPGDALSRRLSIAMAVTSRRGYLLTWFFAAPHDSELKELLEEKIAFDSEPLSKEASVAKPGGGENSASPSAIAPTVTSVGPSAAQPVAGPAEAASVSSRPEAPQASASATPAASPTQQQDTPASASSGPSLLRPSETMQDQQGSGKPLPQQH